MNKFTKIFVGAFLFVALGVTAASAYTHTVTLKYGSRGSQVMSLQQTLNMTSCKVAVTGVGSMGWETTSFGAKTLSAVKCFQAANGLTADGVVGPMTGSKLMVVTSNGSNSGNFPAGCTSAAGYSSTTGQRCDVVHPGLPAGCTSTAGYSSTTGAKCDGSSTGGSSNGPLQGGAGSIEEFNLDSGYSNEEVGEGQSNVKVAGLKIEADDSSDLRITALELTFNEVGSGNDDFEDYADNVTVWYNGSKVAEVQAEDFNDDNDWSRTVSLSGDTVIRRGQTGVFTVAVSAQDNIDSADITGSNGDWTLDFEDVRFVDAQGAVITEDAGTGLVTFSFETFASANDVELELSEASNNPESQVVIVDDNSNTDDVVLLRGKLKAQGSDVNVQEVVVAISKSGTGDIGEIASQFTLKVGTDEDTVDASDGTTTLGGSTACTTQTTCYFAFDDLDADINAGSTVDVVLTADINEVDGTTVAEGDSLSASIDADNIEAEDEEGDDLSTNELTGNISGDAQAFYTEGIIVTPGSTTASAVSVDGTNNDYGTFTIKFSVKAEGQDIYLDRDVAYSQSTSQTELGYNRVAVLTSAGANVTGTGSLSSSDSDAEELTNTFKIADGATADFTLTVSSSASPDADIRAVLYALEWGTADAATGTQTYTFNMGVNGDYKTNYIHVQD